MFKHLEGENIVDPAILQTDAYKLIMADFDAAISDGPTYTCNVCWKLSTDRMFVNLNQKTMELL